MGETLYPQDLLLLTAVDCMSYLLLATEPLGFSSSPELKSYGFSRDGVCLDSRLWENSKEGPWLAAPKGSCTNRYLAPALLAMRG